MAHCVQEEADFYTLSVVHVTICEGCSSWGTNMWCCTIYRMGHPQYVLPTSAFVAYPYLPIYGRQNTSPPSLFLVLVCRRSWLLSFYSFYVNWCAQFLTRLRWVTKRFVVCHVCYILMLFCGTRVSRWKSFFCVCDVFAIIYSSAPRKAECATEAVLMSKHIQIITFYTLLFIRT